MINPEKKNRTDPDNEVLDTPQVPPTPIIIRITSISTAKSTDKNAEFLEVITLGSRNKPRKDYIFL